MLIVKICGGLGNQMFQYAKAYCLTNSNIECKVDLSSFKTYNLHNGYELEYIFGVPNIQAEDNLVKELKDDSRSVFNRIRRIVFGRKRSHVMEGDSIDPNSCTPMLLDGYWQNNSQLIDIDSEIRSLFAFKPKLTNNNINLLKNNESLTLVSMHVRRGDYLESKNSKYAKCSINYYKNAYEYLCKISSSLHVLLFSDDITWCKKNIDFLDSVDYVGWNIGAQSYQDMYLMSLCEHNVIANSSFSWWGAFLNSNPNKVVIYPEFWLKEKKSIDVVTIPQTFNMISND